MSKDEDQETSVFEEAICGGGGVRKSQAVFID
jgi:hypothetical protein